MAWKGSISGGAGCVLKKSSLCSTDVSDGNTGFAVDPPQSRSWPSGAAQRGVARAELDDNFRHEVGGLKADAVAPFCVIFESGSSLGANLTAWR